MNEVTQQIELTLIIHRSYILQHHHTQGINQHWTTAPGETS